MKITFKFAQHKKQIFWVVAILSVVCLAAGESFALTHESTSASGYFGYQYTAAPRIYSQGDLGSRTLVNGQDAPTVRGKPYNVVYYKAGLASPLANVYYYVPQNVLDAEPGYPCMAPRIFLYDLFRTHCTDPRTLPGAQRVAVIYSFIGIEIEVVSVLSALAALGAVYWWYIRK